MNDDARMRNLEYDIKVQKDYVRKMGEMITDRDAINAQLSEKLAIAMDLLLNTYGNAWAWQQSEAAQYGLTNVQKAKSVEGEA